MSKKLTISLIAAGGAGIIALFVWLVGAQLFKFFFVYGRTFTIFFAMMIAIAALVFFLFNRGVAVSDSYSNNASPAKWYWAGSLAIVGGVALIILLSIRVGYDSERQYIDSASITESTEGVAPDYNPRAPYDIAVAGSKANMGSTVGQPQTTKSVADSGENGEWNTLIVRQGFGVGYESAQTVKTPLFNSVNSSDVTFCRFDADKAPLRFGGALIQNNLSRVLDWMLPFEVTYDSADSYAYCDGDTPYVVIPLKQMNSWYAAYETPYGVLTYNGATGEFTTITDSEEIAKIPGSTYPLSLGETQRRSLNAVGELGDYLFGTVGYQTSGGGNISEFQLVNSETDEINFVTPLTPRGQSTSIVGLSVINAKSFTPGELNPIDIYLYPANKPSKSNDLKAQDLRNSYQNLLAFVNDKVDIFEIVPGENGEWVASIGSAQATIYRAVFTVDGDITLYNSAGEEVSRTAINGEPDSDDGEGDGGSGVITPDTDLSELTPAQLRELARQIIDELERRIP